MDKRQIASIYGERFREFGDTPQGVFWNNSETQTLRFQRLFKQFLPIEKVVEVHDVGCGTAELHRYLAHQGIPHVYSGSELVSEMVTTARAKFADVKIWERDFLSAGENESYDIVALSGALNLSQDADPEV